MDIILTHQNKCETCVGCKEKTNNHYGRCGGWANTSSHWRKSKIYSNSIVRCIEYSECFSGDINNVKKILLYIHNIKKFNKKELLNIKKFISSVKSRKNFYKHVEYANISYGYMP